MKLFRKAVPVMLAVIMVITMAVPAAAETAVNPDTSDVPVITPAEMVADSEYAGDEIIVVFDDNVRDRKIETTIESEDAECVEIAEVSEEMKIAVAEIGGDITVEQAIIELADNSGVLYAQPNYKYKVASDMGTNDPYNNDGSSGQWYLSNVKAREAWAALRKSGGSLEPVTVAVIDSGADVGHEDLAANISPDSARIAGHEVKPLKADSDATGHGTHVCGIIGAVANNGRGISGVAAGAGNNLIKIMAIDATSQDDPGEYFDTYGVVSAINYAVKKGADIINMSFGGPGKDLVLEEAVEDAYAAGVTIVAAAGNENSSEFMTPGDNNEVICVCNTTRADIRYEYSSGRNTYSSNYGRDKDVSAPGAGIISTVPGGYDSMTGTSMAAPVVSAVAAMLYMAEPDLTPAQVKNIICGTARDVDAAGFDQYTGYGIVNALDAVNAAKTLSTAAKINKIIFKNGSESTHHINEGTREMLEVLTFPVKSKESVKWSSSNNSVVSVDKYGKITGVAPGTAVVTCSSSQASAVVKIKVGAVIEPEKLVVINRKSIETMTPGQAVLLRTEVMPGYADDKKVYWKSSDQSVVTVDELGHVTARGTGNAYIIGYTYNAKCKDTTEEAIESADARTAVIKVKVVKPADLVKKSDYNLTAVSGGAYSVKLKWKAIPGADGYKIYRNGKLYKKVGANTLSFSNRNLYCGVTYKYYVCAFYGSDDCNASAVKSVKPVPNAPKLSAKSSKGKITVSWSKIPSATKYVLYRYSKAKGKYVAVKTLKGTSYTDRNVTKGKYYNYKVRVFRNTEKAGKVWSKYSDMKKVTCK